VSIFSRSSVNKLNHHTKYRDDIDGLRALAIVPVVLFHAFPSILPGGFIGVDIFFVISGFLISTIIFRELKKGKFSFLDFYARRVRRLFPALSLVLYSTLIFGWFALDADEYKMLGEHVAAGAGFVQNFILLGEVGYFDIGSELKPLLHLWSLAIEEQFYLVFPLIVWIAWRIGLNLLALVLFIAIASLAANLYSVRIDPVGTFYFPHMRIWELMAGSILAYATSRSTTLSEQADTGIRKHFNETSNSTFSRFGASRTSLRKNIRLNKSTLSWLGLGLIVVSTLVFDKNHHYPGWRAMIPVMGAVLIIYAGQHSWINRNLLGNKLVVFVGLISYPLYLWHWPLLSFARIIESEPLSTSLSIAIVAISFILATLTYILIEKPIRSGNFQKFWTIALVIIMFCVGVLGILAHERELTSRLGANVQEVKKWEERRSIFEENCAELFPKWNYRKGPFKCRFLEKGKPEIVVIGDSHAARIYYGISHYIGKEYNTALFANGCAMPFYDLSVGIPKKYRRSGYQYGKSTQINKALDFSINEPSVKLVILTTSACWNNVVDIKNLLETNAKRIVESKMRLTFERLMQSDKEVIYVLDNPLLDFDPKSCVSRPFRINSNKATCKMKRETFNKQRPDYFQLVNRVLSDYPKIKVFDVASKLCDHEYCYSVIDNRLLYHDTSHLGHDGSKYIGQLMVPLITDSLNEGN
jgi:peptidoglycan/LPS O-acetylase OafA/YrhL